MASDRPPLAETASAAGPPRCAGPLRPPAAVWSLGVLAALAAAVGLSVLVRFTWAGDSLEERRARVQSLEPADQQRLKRNHERFLALDPAEQERIRQLYQAIQAEPNADELLAVMQRYYEWLKTLTAYQRAELKDLPPDKRIERMQGLRAEEARRETERTQFMNAPRAKGFQQAMEDPVSRSLTADDIDGLFRWIEQIAPKYKARFLESLPEDRRQEIRAELEKSQDPSRERDFLGWMWLRWQMDHPGELPPFSEEELASLRSMLSEATRKRLEGMSDDEQRGALTRWIRFLVAWEYGLRHGGSRFPLVSQDELAKFLETLDGGERSYYLSLSGDEMRRQLTWKYMREKMPDEWFRDMGRRGGWGSGFGPGRGGPAGGGRWPPGGFPPGGPNADRPGRGPDNGHPSFGPPMGGPNRDGPPSGGRDRGGPPPDRPDSGNPPPDAAPDGSR